MTNEQAKPGRADRTADAASGMAAQAERDETAQATRARPAQAAPQQAPAPTGEEKKKS